MGVASALVRAKDILAVAMAVGLLAAPSEVRAQQLCYIMRGMSNGCLPGHTTMLVCPGTGQSAWIADSKYQDTPDGPVWTDLGSMDLFKDCGKPEKYGATEVATMISNYQAQAKGKDLGCFYVRSELDARPPEKQEHAVFNLVADSASPACQGFRGPSNLCAGVVSCPFLNDGINFPTLIPCNGSGTAGTGLCPSADECIKDRSFSRTNIDYVRSARGSGEFTQWSESHADVVTTASGDGICLALQKHPGVPESRTMIGARFTNGRCQNHGDPCVVPNIAKGLRNYPGVKDSPTAAGTAAGKAN